MTGGWFIVWPCFIHIIVQLYINVSIYIDTSLYTYIRIYIYTTLYIYVENTYNSIVKSREYDLHKDNVSGPKLYQEPMGISPNTPWKKGLLFILRLFQGDQTAESSAVCFNHPAVCLFPAAEDVLLIGACDRIWFCNWTFMTAKLMRFFFPDIASHFDQIFLSKHFDEKETWS